MKLPKEFVSLSQQIGADPLLVQGPGGNTSIKIDGQMWIKASGTELAEAYDKNIFVAVDPAKALLELEGAGDGSCRSALIDPECGLRPSIETTFHAMFQKKFVFHFHSVATICHAIAEEGRASLTDKLDGLTWVSAPYMKPGIPLTKAIRAAVGNYDVQVVVLENHGVIVVADTIEEIRTLINEVERRLDLPTLANAGEQNVAAEVAGWEEVPAVAALVNDPLLFSRATAGTYYPDHVVFLGPALPSITPAQFAEIDPSSFPVPAILVEGEAVYIKSDATLAQRAMLECLLNVLSRIPSDWTLVPIGQEAEAELLNWDAEKYRQALAKREA
jgi:rhamnose utilization protein RhaD (predicted bifunctional aldolase and dehydrogenase)